MGHEKGIRKYIIAVVIAGGVFIVIFVGIGMACVTLAFEYWWYKYKRNPRIVNAGGDKSRMKKGEKPGRLDAGYGDLYPRLAFQPNNARSLAKVDG